MRFIGREKELETLNQVVKKKTAKLIVIRGRRRIGKSRLAEQFGKNFDDMLMFSGLAPQKGVNAKMQREDFATQMADLLSIAKPAADDWGMLFRTLARFTEKQNLLLILDEITWMGGADPTFLGKLKTVWDTHFKKNPKLTVILSGSISSWIEENILSSTGFVGRITLDLKLDPLPLPDCNEFWFKQKNNVSAYEKFKLLSITGGIPRYLEEIVPTQSAEDNIKQTCFHPGGLLFREFDNIFSDLFSRRSKTYKNIVLQLVNRSKTLTEVCKSLNITRTGTIGEYLEDLITAGFVTQDIFWNLKGLQYRKSSRFRLSDNYARFYLKFIEPNKERIETGSYSLPANWESILGLQFENLILSNRQAIWSALRLDPSEITLHNPYFQSTTKRSKGTQIDYLIQTKFGTLYLCEIKFSKNEQNSTIITETQEKIDRLIKPKHCSIRPVLIHVNGVSDEVIDSEFFAHIIDFGNLLAK